MPRDELYSRMANTPISSNTPTVSSSTYTTYDNVYDPIATWTTNRINIDGIGVNGYEPRSWILDYNIPNVSIEGDTDGDNTVFTVPVQLQAKLDEFARKIYKIIEEHSKIDISEEEFMDLLHEE